MVEWAPPVRFPSRFCERTDRQCAASLEKLHCNLITATRRSNVFLHCFVAVLECVNTGITAAPVFLCVSPPPPLLDKIYYTDILSFRLLRCFFFLSFLLRQACLARFWARDVLLLSLWLCAVRLDGDSSSRLQWRVLVHLTCLDWLDVIGRVQSLSAVVQTTSTPALLVLVFSLGQFVTCEETPVVSRHVVVCQKEERRVI